MTDDRDDRELLDRLEDAERRLEAIAEIAPDPELRRRFGGCGRPTGRHHGDRIRSGGCDRHG